MTNTLGTLRFPFAMVAAITVFDLLSVMLFRGGGERLFKVGGEFNALLKLVNCV